MEEILKTGLSLISAVIFSVGLGLALILLIHLGFLNSTLHQIEKTLENINKNLDAQTNKKQQIHKGEES